MTNKVPGVKKFSVSLTSELSEAIDLMCIRTNLARSRLIENILRENKYITQLIEASRLEPKDGKYVASPKKEVRNDVNSTDSPAYAKHDAEVEPPQ